MGLWLSAAYWLLLRWWPTTVAAAMVLALQAGVTGGIHLDGFMDTADGLGSGKPREEALEIMRDSRTGAMGVISLMFLLLVKWSALSGLARPAAERALVLAPAFGRWAMVWAAAHYGYARSGSGLGRAFAGLVGSRELAWSFATSTLLALVLGREGGLLSFLAAGAVGALVARSLAGRLGGMTGDTFGFLNEVVEAFYLLLVHLLVAVPWPGGSWR